MSRRVDLFVDQLLSRSRVISIELLSCYFVLIDPNLTEIRGLMELPGPDIVGM
jgi:hypothetical protein